MFFYLCNECFHGKESPQDLPIERLVCSQCGNKQVKKIALHGPKSSHREELSFQAELSSRWDLVQDAHDPFESEVG
jgi:hypothetical protein